MLHERDTSRRTWALANTGAVVALIGDDGTVVDAVAYGHDPGGYFGLQGDFPSASGGQSLLRVSTVGVSGRMPSALRADTPSPGIVPPSPIPTIPTPTPIPLPLPTPITPTPSPTPTPTPIPPSPTPTPLPTATPSPTPAPIPPTPLPTPFANAHSSHSNGNSPALPGRISESGADAAGARGWHCDGDP